MKVPHVNKYVAIAVVQGSRFIVIEGRRGSKRVRFPGGKPQRDEMPIVTAARELQEELGIVARKLKQLPATYKNVVDGVEWEGTFFICTEFDGVPCIQETRKHLDWQYVYFDELMGIKPEFDVASMLSTTHA